MRAIWFERRSPASERLGLAVLGPGASTPAPSALSRSPAGSPAPPDALRGRRARSVRQRGNARGRVERRKPAACTATPSR